MLWPEPVLSELSEASGLTPEEIASNAAAAAGYRRESQLYKAGEL